MTLTSSLIAVREHKAGEPVGYGGTWISERDTRLGVVAMGYGDGYPRAAPSGTPVLVNGREVPIVGRVAMDMICVDLGPQAQDKAGDAVVLWGEGLPVERIAEITKVSAYELITRLTSRVAMKYSTKPLAYRIAQRLIRYAPGLRRSKKRFIPLRGHFPLNILSTCRHIRFIV